jgi:hypothetical protein
MSVGKSGLWSQDPPRRRGVARSHQHGRSGQTIAGRRWAGCPLTVVGAGPKPEALPTPKGSFVSAIVGNQFALPTMVRADGGRARLAEPKPETLPTAKRLICPTDNRCLPPRQSLASLQVPTKLYAPRHARIDFANHLYDSFGTLRKVSNSTRTMPKRGQ